MINPITFGRTVLASALTLAVAASSTVAAPLMVDLNATDVAGGDWHSISFAQAANTINFTDGPSLSFSAGFYGRTPDTLQDPQDSAFADTLYEPAVDDYFHVQYASGGTVTMTIGDLDADTTYTLTVISAKDTEPGFYGHRGIFSLNGTPADNMTAGEQFHAHQDGWLDGNLLTWTDITPDATGKLVLSVELPQNSNLFVNGFILVPEPASLALLAVGSLCLIRRTR